MEETVYIDGCASTSAIDSSGERVAIEGLDISSLSVSGCFNWEHDQLVDSKGQKFQLKVPSNVVGKILKAKKIFSPEDCEDERQRYYWDKVQMPYVYVMGALFNAYTQSGAEVAGMFRYSYDHRNSGQQNVLFFSVEGGKLGQRDGITVLRSVARKVTICVHPANHTCIAEMIPNPKAEQKDDLDSLFKSYGDIEIQLFKTEAPAKVEVQSDQMQKSAAALGIEPMSKSNVVPIKAPAAAKGMSSETHGPHLGNTKSGKAIFGGAKIHEYKGFSSQDHQQAAMMHHSAAGSAVHHKDKEFHSGKMKLHLQAAKTAENKENRFNVGKKAHAAAAGMMKALDAGSTNAAPGTLVGGAALQTESILDSKKKKKTDETKIVSVSSTAMPTLTKAAVPGSKYPSAAVAQGKPSFTVGVPKFAPIAKSEWIERSEQEFKIWPKKEAFIDFMKSEKPEMTMTEIEALGKTLALAESIRMEAELAKLIK